VDRYRLPGLRRQRETSYDLGERANEDRSKDQVAGGSGLGMMVYRPVAAITPCGKRSSHGWSMVLRGGIATQ
jgi:hypothetical protein